MVRAEDHSLLRIAKTDVVLLDAAPEFFNALIFGEARRRVVPATCGLWLGTRKKISIGL